MRQWLIRQFGQVLTPLAQRFQHDLQQPQLAQQRVKQMLCDRLTASEYGQSLGIQSSQDWSRLPIVTYDDLASLIHPPARRSPLTPDPIQFYERTSGSQGIAKWIPYTQALRRSFSHLFCLWAHDLIQHGPAFSTGQVYACVSPQFTGAAGDPGTGLENDAEYLDRWLQLILKPFLVSLPNVRHIRTATAFKHQLSLTLLQAKRLETISIWSPSFLTLLLEYIATHRQTLLEELAWPTTDLRAVALRQPDIPWADLWPQLKLISCWDGAASADSANWVRSHFPNVLVQGKGLLATEAPITLPLIPAQGYVPLLNEVLLEFCSDSDADTILPLHELEVGKTYTLLLSQKGGLYRYRLGDRVHVTHYYHQTPCLEFVGREGDISDLVGEKLSTALVSAGIQQLIAEKCLDRISTRFISLVPVQNPAGYVLVLDRAGCSATTIAQKLETYLLRSPHYRHARLLGQLQPLEVLLSPQAPEALILQKAQHGARWGDVKANLLETNPRDRAGLTQ
jgi:hypothetical protein